MNAIGWWTQAKRRSGNSVNWKRNWGTYSCLPIVAWPVKRRTTSKEHTVVLVILHRPDKSSTETRMWLIWKTKPTIERSFALHIASAVSRIES